MLSAMPREAGHERPRLGPAGGDTTTR